MKYINTLLKEKSWCGDTLLFYLKIKCTVFVLPAHCQLFTQLNVALGRNFNGTFYTEIEDKNSLQEIRTMMLIPIFRNV